MSSFWRGFVKKASIAVDPGVLGALGGLTTGYSQGRQVAESTANALSNQGYKTTNSDLARNAATILAPVGAIGGMALGYKYKGKLMGLARKATKEPILHMLVEGVIPFGTGALGGMTAGAGTGALVSLRGKSSKEKKDE